MVSVLVFHPPLRGSYCHALILQVKDLRLFLEPLFKRVIDAVTIETVEDWGACLTDISVCVLT